MAVILFFKVSYCILVIEWQCNMFRECKPLPPLKGNLCQRFGHLASDSLTCVITIQMGSMIPDVVVGCDGLYVVWSNLIRFLC